MINDIEKKYIYLIFGIAIILFIIVLVVIWSPMFNNNENKTLAEFTNYNNYVEIKKKEYKNKILNYINIENIDETINKIDDTFLKNYNLDKDNVKQFLIDNEMVGYSSSSTIVSFSNLITDNKKYIYSYVYKIGNNEKKIHIIENYYNDYTISFEQEGYPIIATEGYMSKYGDISFDITEKKSYEEELVLEYCAQNNGNDEYTINLENVKDSAITIFGDSTYDMSSVVVGSEYSKIILSPGSKVFFEVSYAIPIELQSLIKSLTFNNVKDYSGNNIVISLDIK